VEVVQTDTPLAIPIGLQGQEGQEQQSEQVKALEKQEKQERIQLLKQQQQNKNQQTNKQRPNNPQVARKINTPTKLTTIMSLNRPSRSSGRSGGGKSREKFGNLDDSDSDYDSDYSSDYSSDYDSNLENSNSYSESFGNLDGFPSDPNYSNAKYKNKNIFNKTYIQQEDSNNILELIGQKFAQNWYKYFTSISQGNKIIKIMVNNRNRRELYDGDIVYIPELRRSYRVKIDEMDMIQYNPYYF
jgi:DNA mismatch repair ATPase MutL